LAAEQGAAAADCGPEQMKEVLAARREAGEPLVVEDATAWAME